MLPAVQRHPRGLPIGSRPGPHNAGIKLGDLARRGDSAPFSAGCGESPRQVGSRSVESRTDRKVKGREPPRHPLIVWCPKQPPGLAPQQVADRSDSATPRNHPATQWRFSRSQAPNEKP